MKGRRSGEGPGHGMTVRLLCGGLALLLAACGGHPPETPAPKAAGPGVACPTAEPVAVNEPHPGRVAVENQTDQEVRVLLDRCSWWTVLGSVDAGRTAYLKLPSRLIRFGEGLRFQAYTPDPERWYGSYASDFQVPMAHLVISPETALRVQVPDDSVQGPSRAASPVMVHEAGGTTTVSAFSFDSFSVLSWRCTVEGPELVFSSGAKLRTDPQVTLSVAGKEPSTGVWSRVQAFTDGAVAPPELVESFTWAIRQVPAATLLVGAPGDTPEHYTFSTVELDEALRSLACLG